MSVRSTAQPLCCSQAVLLFLVILVDYWGQEVFYFGQYQALVSGSFAAEEMAAWWCKCIFCALAKVENLFLRCTTKRPRALAMHSSERRS